MRCRRIACLLPIAIVILACCHTACRRSAPGTPVFAILLFDNLTGSRGYDWFSAAGPALLDWQLFGQKNMSAFSAANLNDAVAGHATSYVHTRFQPAGSMLEIDTDIEDAASRRIREHHSFRVDNSAEGAVVALGRLARALAPNARHLNPDAARAIVPFGEALLSIDSKMRTNLLEGALNQAADFTPAWLIRIELDIQSRSTAATDDIAAAMPYADSLDRARLRYLSTRLSGDAATQIAALVDLTRRAPAQASAWQTLAELQTNTRSFLAAAASWTTVTRLQPWNDNAFNQLGYCRAWSGDLSGAQGALAEYQRLDPENANPLDSLGEVQFFFQRFPDSERSFLGASERNPAFLDGIDLLKAAEARLMAGEPADASRLFRQFLSWRRNAMHDPSAPLWLARWDFLKGSRRQAMSELARALPQMSGDARSRAESQYSFWLFASGNAQDARAHAGLAASAAQTPASHGLALLCQFLALPSASAEQWTSRANTMLHDSPPRFRESALAYALALDHHPADALPLLERIYAGSPPGDDGEQRAILISVLLAMGRRTEAHRLLWPMPIPIASDNAEFSALVFPRWLAWTAQDVRFRAYSGDLHLVFE